MEREGEREEGERERGVGGWGEREIVREKDTQTFTKNITAVPMSEEELLY